MLDIFNNDAFSVTSLTDAISEKRVRSGRLGELGLFQTTAVTTLTIALESIGDTIQLVAPSPRGAPGEVRDNEKRSIRNLSIPHFQRDWSVVADEVQGVRAYGSETQLATVQGIVAQKIAVNIADLDLTDEYSRIGAIQGIVTYKGGQTLNLFTEFGVAQHTEVDFDLDAASPGACCARSASTPSAPCTKVLGGVPFDYLHAFVGDNFFDDPARAQGGSRHLYRVERGADPARQLMSVRTDPPTRCFEFGGIVFEIMARSTVPATARCSARRPTRQSSCPSACPACSNPLRAGRLQVETSQHARPAALCLSGRWRTARASTARRRPTRCTSARVLPR